MGIKTTYTPVLATRSQVAKYEAMQRALEQIQWLYSTESFDQWCAANPGRPRSDFYAAAGGRAVTISEVALDGLALTGATVDWRKAVGHEL